MILLCIQDGLNCDIFIKFFGDSLIKISVWNIIDYMGRWLTFSSLQMSLSDDNFFKKYNIKINDFLLYEFEISLQLMGTLKIIIHIVEEDRKWKCYHKTNMT